MLRQCRPRVVGAAAAGAQGDQEQPPSASAPGGKRDRRGRVRQDAAHLTVARRGQRGGGESDQEDEEEEEQEEVGQKEEEDGGGSGSGASRSSSSSSSSKGAGSGPLIDLIIDRMVPSIFAEIYLQVRGWWVRNGRFCNAR